MTGVTMGYPAVRRRIFATLAGRQILKGVDDARAKYPGLWRILLTVMIGLPACLLLSWYLLQLEIQRQTGEYQQNASRVVNAVQQGLQNDDDLLMSLRFYFDTVGDPTRDGFIKFATPAFLVRPELESMLYAPLVRKDGADAFEVEAKALFPIFKSGTPHPANLLLRAIFFPFIFSNRTMMPCWA